MPTRKMPHWKYVFKTHLLAWDVDVVIVVVKDLQRDTNKDVAESEREDVPEELFVCLLELLLKRMPTERRDLLQEDVLWSVTRDTVNVNVTTEEEEEEEEREESVLKEPALSKLLWRDARVRDVEEDTEENFVVIVVVCLVVLAEQSLALVWENKTVFVLV